MQQLIIILHVIVAVCLIALILLQHGKGADAGATFGSGASNTMFGSQGPMSFLMKITYLLAAIFFATSITLGYMASRAAKSGSNILDLTAASQHSAPASSSSSLPVTPSTTTPAPSTTTTAPTTTPVPASAPAVPSQHR